jgi:hypothetical protein
MEKDIEPILQVFSSYLQHLVLSEDEVRILCNWLMESEDNEDLFNEISNEGKWKEDCPANISWDLKDSLERIRMCLFENSENH